MCMTIAQSAKDHDEPHGGSTAETPMNSGEGSSRRAGKDTSVAAETSLAADLQQQARRERSCPLTALNFGAPQPHRRSFAGTPQLVQQHHSACLLPRVPFRRAHIIGTSRCKTERVRGPVAGGLAFRSGDKPRLISSAVWSTTSTTTRGSPSVHTTAVTQLWRRRFSPSLAWHR